MVGMFCLLWVIVIEERVVWKIYLRFIILLWLSVKIKIDFCKSRERFLVIYSI